jgi:hypothetical protein
MKKSNFHLKNQMFVANGIANVIGVLLANALALTIQEPYPKEFLEYPIVVDAEWIYEDNKKTDFSNGQIIFLSTDGIWEARNKKGEMLGKEPILNAIRQNSSSDATQIIDAIFDILDKFIGEVKLEDDITSVVVKM